MVDHSATAAAKVEDLRQQLNQFQVGPLFTRVLTSQAVEVMDLESHSAEVVWEELVSAACITAYDLDNPNSSDNESPP